MAAETFVIVYDKALWNLARVASDEVELRQIEIADGDAAAAAEAVARELSQWGYGGQEVCLALPSSMFLTAAIDCSKMPRKNRRTAMIFQLEEHLPIDAERLTVDFLPLPPQRALGIAVETRRVELILESLSAGGIEVASICPSALLMLWELCDRDATDGQYVLVAGTSNVDVFRMAGNQPVGWRTTGTQATDLVRCIESDLLANPSEDTETAAVVIGEMDPAASGALQQEIPLRLEDAPLEPMELTARGGASALAGKKAGWVNLRKDALAEARPWKRFKRLAGAAAVLAIFLPVVLAGLFYYRAMLYENTIGDRERLQAAEFHSLYDNRKAPGSVKRFLQAEWQQLSGLSGAGRGVPHRPNALIVLKEFIASLPRTVRVRVYDLRINGASLAVKGELRQYSDADAIKRRLGRAGFKVEDPGTEKIRDLVHFDLEASYEGKGDSDLAAGEGPP
jgi:hypothetical protein